MHKAVQSWAGLHCRFKSFVLKRIGYLVLMTQTDIYAPEMVVFARRWWLLTSSCRIGLLVSEILLAD